MTTETIIIGLFCRVDDVLGDEPKDPQAKLHLSEIVTLGMLFALKKERGRRFYRWLSANYRQLFPALPERTRLFRLFEEYREYTDRFLAAPTLLGVIDSFGIELIHPYREFRGNGQIGRKGLSNHRWIVGAKLCVLLNHLGLPVSWECGGANLPDQAFHNLITEVADEMMVVFSDTGFHAKKGDPANLVVCQRGEQNFRMVVETFYSLFSLALDGKHMAHRSWEALASHIGYGLAAMSLLLQWDGLQCDEFGFVQLSLAGFVL
jgi:hypothetical protein